jgi:hypothetical protein
MNALLIVVPPMLPMPTMPPPGRPAIPSAAASVGLSVGDPNIPGIGMKPIPIVIFWKLAADWADCAAVEADCARASALEATRPKHASPSQLARIDLDLAVIDFRSFSSLYRRLSNAHGSFVLNFDSANDRKTLKNSLFRECPVFVICVKPEVFLFFPVSLKHLTGVTRSNETGSIKERDGLRLPGGDPGQRDRTRRG